MDESKDSGQFEGNLGTHFLWASSISKSMMKKVPQRGMTSQYQN